MTQSKSTKTHSELTPSERLSHITTQIFYLNGKLLRFGDEFAAQFGLTAARWQLLGAISLAAEAQTSPQIAERMGMTRQGAQKQLNLLLEAGLIVALENEQHKRSPKYALSAKGKRTFEQVNAAWLQVASSWAENFSEKKLTATQKSLDKLGELI
ncbi:hypothetical protein B0181_09605 [Moraxella caviae]|uniref:MarR family n=1 Tax=Moraxella caviae TaxID=34060 RepID=A0A1S9ZW86_9GAMM|nr:helix-turn-helix domain-containing protein [Moraxella caviae]OOR87802.1 hypothetical protein B0181_09605 [Moraxella caviae]STZ10558.1 MarR family [Moraxella caviae]VEW12970.1 MarR family [Moraxella caviae]